MRLLNDQELAEDCVSETFSRFLQVARKAGDPIENVRAYLYRVAHNWITDHYRRQPLTPLVLDVEIKDCPKSNPSLIAAEEMEKEQVRKAILKLPADQQQVIHLRFLEDWSYPGNRRYAGQVSGGDPRFAAPSFRIPTPDVGRTRR